MCNELIYLMHKGYTVEFKKDSICRMNRITIRKDVEGFDQPIEVSRIMGEFDDRYLAIVLVDMRLGFEQYVEALKGEANGAES